MAIESMPKTVIWTGACVALAGGILVAAAPLALDFWWAPNSDEWATANGLLQIVVAIARTVLAPLGAALVAAGLVMIYVDRRLQGDRIADRPRRWRFPPSDEDN